MSWNERERSEVQVLGISREQTISTEARVAGIVSKEPRAVSGGAE